MKTITISICLVLLITFSVKATVIDTSAIGFTVKHEIQIKGKAMDVFRMFIDVGHWWDSVHTYSGNAANLSLDARPNGCFCEKLPDGGVAHMTVIYVEPGKVLRMDGALGPLQAMAVKGILTVTFKESEGNTTVTMSYTVGGYYSKGLQKIARKVDEVLTAQLEGFKKFTEK